MKCIGGDVRSRRVRVQINARQSQDVVGGVLAVLQRVLAGHIERVVPRCEIGGAGEEARAGRDGGGEERAGGDGEELHCCLLVVLIDFYYYCDGGEMLV